MINKPKVKGKTWLKDITEYGIKYISGDLELKNLISGKNPLICSRCSRTKGKGGQFEVPKNFYVSSANIRFYRWCEDNKFEYGILSDKYGLHLWDERLEFYDIHPSTLSAGDFTHLAKLIKKKMEGKWKSFLFWNSSPIMSSPYFYMMKLTGFDIYYITKLRSINRPSFGFF